MRRQFMNARRAAIAAAILAGSAQPLVTPVLAQIPEAILSDGSDEQTQTGDDSAAVKLFGLISGGRKLDGETDDAVKAALAEINADCLGIERYQVVTRGGAFSSLKVKCAARPVYLLTVGPQGIGVLSGGDRSVERIVADEGDFRVLEGDAPMPKYMQVEDDFDREISFRAGSMILGALIVAGLLIVWWWLRRQQRVAPWRNLKTEDKDALIADAEEVEPNIFHHPRGVWIARGRRGKRRLFENRMLARLYRDRGIKILQVR